MEIFTRLSDEHQTLLLHVQAIQTAAEAKDAAALRAAIAAARVALTTELDAHIALEEQEAFPQLAQTVGIGVIAPFREEHVEIRALRDTLLTAVDAGRAPFDTCLDLCTSVREHQQREDLMLFPAAASHA